MAKKRKTKAVKRATKKDLIKFTAAVHDLQLALDEIDYMGCLRSTFSQLCDEYCRFPRECECEDELVEHCESCPLGILLG